MHWILPVAVICMIGIQCYVNVIAEEKMSSQYVVKMSEAYPDIVNANDSLNDAIEKMTLSYNKQKEELEGKKSNTESSNSDELQDRIGKLVSELEELKQNNEKLKIENNDLIKVNENLIKENENLINENSILKEQVSNGNSSDPQETEKTGSGDEIGDEADLAIVLGLVDSEGDNPDSGKRIKETNIGWAIRDFAFRYYKEIFEPNESVHYIRNHALNALYKLELNEESLDIKTYKDSVDIIDVFSGLNEENVTEEFIMNINTGEIIDLHPSEDESTYSIVEDSDVSQVFLDNSTDDLSTKSISDGSFQ